MRLSIRSALAAVALAAAMALPSVSHAASWQWAYATANVNLRAGPSVSYPAVATVPYGSQVRLYGCLPRWSWCDVSWRGIRGWMSGRYLQVQYAGHRRYVPDVGVYVGVPFLGFDIGTYWGDYYRDRSWYHDRDRYDGRDYRRHDYRHDNDRRKPSSRTYDKNWKPDSGWRRDSDRDHRKPWSGTYDKNWKPNSGSHRDRDSNRTWRNDGCSGNNCTR